MISQTAVASSAGGHRVLFPLHGSDKGRQTYVRSYFAIRGALAMLLNLIKCL